MKKRILITVFLAAIIVLYFARESMSESNVAPKNKDETSNTTQVYDPFIDIDILADSAIVYDIDKNKILYNKNEDNIYPLASIAKLASSLVIRSELSPGSVFSLEREDLLAEGENGLKIGDNWSVDELNAFSLVVSSNDGITALSSRVESENSFVNLMSTKMLELNIPDLSFLNPTGLDETEFLAGGYGTAFGVVKLAEAFLALEPEISKRTIIEEEEFFSQDAVVHNAKNTNKALSEVPNPLLSKTGFTDLAGGNVVVIFSPDKRNRIAIAILNSTKDGRFSDLLALIERTKILY